MNGTVVGGRYPIVRPLAEGGAGSVFLASDPLADRSVAIKFFPPVRSSAREFRREAAIALRARHPNLAGLLDAGVEDGRAWLAMEYVDGRDLRTELESGAYPAARAVRVAVQVFAALDALHRLGLAHGDIKPENLMIHDDRVRIVDFGRGWLNHLLEGAGVYPGTPPYMHPRLYARGAPTAQTDCFAAWITLWELIMGARPYTTGDLRRAYPDDRLPTPGAAPGEPPRTPGASAPRADPGDLPPRPPLANPALEAIVDAGLSGRLRDARSGWLALKRWMRGRTDLPAPRAPAAEADPALTARVLDDARRGRSSAMTGDVELGRAMLEELHRAWLREERGHVMWIRADWGSPAEPLSGALSLAGHAADTFENEEFAAIIRALGPLGAALASASPAVRAWIPATSGREPTAEQLTLALRRLVATCPRPPLVLVDGLDRLDGSSRRFLSVLVNAEEVVLVGTGAPGSPHGMPHEVALPRREGAGAADPPLPGVVADVLARGRALDLPLGPLLALATGISAVAMEDAALEAEAADCAFWTGRAVVARLGAPSPDFGRWCREAARRLADASEPELAGAGSKALLVARYAMLGHDDAALVGVLDDAVQEALRLDPLVALELLARDPRPRTAVRLLEKLRATLLARDLALAATVLSSLEAMPDVPLADRLEARGEVAYRQGLVASAVASFEAAAAALGEPIRKGWTGLVEDLFVVARVALGIRARPRPNPRLARVLERLSDLYFCSDHRPMLRADSRWLASAPTDPRARAIELVWRALLGRHGAAATLERALLAEIQEDRDPVGAAVVRTHGGYARLLRAETEDAFAEGMDACTRLVHAGDPYLATLAGGLVWLSGYHLGMVDALRACRASIVRLAEATRDERAASWAEGASGLISWLSGRSDEAVGHMRSWAEDGEQRGDSTSALARRYLGEILLENGDVAGAVDQFRLCEASIRQWGMLSDHTEAVVIGELVADAMARIAGEPGAPNRRALARRLRRVVRLAPRWSPRAHVAQAWQALAARDTARAILEFEAGFSEAQALRHAHDAWWALAQRARALGEDDASPRAFAARHGLKTLQTTPHHRIG